MRECLYSLDFDMMCYLIHSDMPQYAVSVRQYRPLQSRLLQCIPHGKPPCDLLMLSQSLGTHKRLSLSGCLCLFKELYWPFRAHTIKLEEIKFLKGSESSLSLCKQSSVCVLQNDCDSGIRNVREFNGRNHFA